MPNNSTIVQTAGAMSPSAAADGVQGIKRILVFDLSSAIALHAPRLSPEGTQIVFSASGELKTASVLDGLGAVLAWMSVPAVRAHGAPWELWAISIEDGQLTQLTRSELDGPWPTWWTQAGEQYLALLDASGIYLYGEDKLIRLAIVEREGEMIWIPPNP